MITDGEKWHYLTVKNLSRLLRRITSNHVGDFYCLNCFCAYSTKNKFEEKSIKLPFVAYADLECLLEKMSTCQNNLHESSTTEINKHTPSGYSLFTHCLFDKTKNKLDYYRDKDCMKKFCKDLREQATIIINYEKKKMTLLTTKENIYHNEQEICYKNLMIIMIIKSIIK